MRISRNKLCLREQAELQAQKMIIAEQTATIDYIAMMTDTELPAKEDDINAQYKVFEG